MSILPFMSDLSDSEKSALSPELEIKNVLLVDDDETLAITLKQLLESHNFIVTTSANGDMVCPGGGVGPSCLECLFGGSTYTTTDVATSAGTSEAGNYAVTVTLGGSSAAW